jgi:hypothetical protein
MTEVQMFFAEQQAKAARTAELLAAAEVALERNRLLQEAYAKVNKHTEREPQWASTSA